MLFTTGLLGLLYVVFAVVLFKVLNFGLAPMLIIVIGLAFYFGYGKSHSRLEGHA